MQRIRTSLVLMALLGGSGLALAQPADGETPAAPPSAPTAAEETKPAEPAPAPAPVVQPPATTVPQATDTSTEAAAEAPVAASGFALEMRLETGQTLIDNDFALPTTQTGFFLGHRGESLTIGVGFELGRITESHSEPNGMGGTFDSEQSATTLLLMPGIRFAMARSTDRKTELLGQIDAGYGATWLSSDNGGGGGGSDPPATHRLRLQAGPSIRHWVSPSFAVGATAGLRYDRMSRSVDNGLGGDSEMALANTTLFGSLQVTAVF